MTAQVVIDDIIPRTQLIATAGQTVFNTNWTADVETDILVYARADGIPPNDSTQLVSSSLYNVTFIGGSRTVRVTFLSGRTLNDVITIVRNTPSERTNLYINTNFVPSMLNQDFGILTLVDQQAQMYDTVINPGYNVSATIAAKDKVLPILAANEVWRMNEDASAIEAYEINANPAPNNSPFLVYTDANELPNSQNLGALTSGLLKQSVLAGVATLEIAVPSLDYSIPSDFGTMAFQDANAVDITGGSASLATGQVAGAPVNATDIVNKQYVDTAILNVNTFTARVATTANLSATYNPGSSGVGATLTATANGAASIDGVSIAVNDVVLFKDQTSSFQNGLYYLSTNGTGGSPAIFTRSADYDQPSEILAGDLVSVVNGTQNSGSSWQQTATVSAVGTDPITFTKFSQYGVLPYPFTVGTTSVTSTGTQLNLLNTLTLVPVTKVVTQVFTVNGTYTPTTGMTYCYVHAVGGGAAGGGGFLGGAGTCGIGAGGGSGAEIWAWFDAATIGASKSITIGAGGTGVSAGNGGAGGATSLGSLIVAGGGSGGDAGVNSSTAIFSIPGVGGPTTTVPAGQLGRTGQSGLTGFTLSGQVGVPGQGGQTTLSGGGRQATGGNSNGGSASGPGGGGGGAYAVTTNNAGGNGSSGVIYITELLAA